MMQATVVLDTGVTGVASGGGPEVIGGIRRLGVFGRTGPDETAWMGTAPETTTAFLGRVLRPRVVVAAAGGLGFGGDVATDREGVGGRAVVRVRCGFGGVAIGAGVRRCRSRAWWAMKRWRFARLRRARRARSRLWAFVADGLTKTRACSRRAGVPNVPGGG